MQEEELERRVLQASEAMPGQRRAGVTGLAESEADECAGEGEGRHGV